MPPYPRGRVPRRNYLPARGKPVARKPKEGKERQRRTRSDQGNGSRYLRGVILACKAARSACKIPHRAMEADLPAGLPWVRAERRHLPNLERLGR